MRHPTASARPNSWLAILGALVLWALLLAACADDPEDTVLEDPEPAAPVDEPVDDPVDDPEDEPADAPAATLEGATVSLVAPYGPGGAYDRILRAVSDHFARASDATVVVMNEPGAGGLVGTNNTFVAREQDFRVALLNTAGLVSAVLGEAEGVNFDLGEFQWVGSLTSDPETLIVAADGPYDSVEALLDASGERTLRFGAPGPGDSQYVNALLFASVFDVDIQIITGFDGAPDVYAAVLRGDVDAAIGSITSTLPGVEAGDLSVLAYMGELPEALAEATTPEAAEAVRAAPSMLDLDAGDEGRELIALHESVLQIGRALAAPPSSPEDRVAAYRAAFEQAATDPSFVEAALDQGIFIEWNPAEVVEAVMADILDAPPAYVQLMVDAYAAD